jgi:hypothetical protein
MDEINLNIIRDAFGRLVYTHKTNEKAAELCFKREANIKLRNVILLTLTSGSAVGSIIKGDYFIIITSFLATLSLFYLVYQFSFDPGHHGEEYKECAKKLWYMREKYQNLIADIMNERYTTQEIAEKRDVLLDELNKIFADSPATDSRAYSEARAALKIDEEMTFTAKEIDNFLPEKLRITKE